MSRISIRAEHVSKMYRIGALQEQGRKPVTALIKGMALEPLRRIKSLAQNQLPQFANEELWAVKDVSFDIHEGEVVGLIGANGAGKTTLLRILSRITPPSEGRIYMNGRVAALLAVGTGFNQELTGRENVYLNGTILGMSKQEIDRKFDEIVDFAGVEKYIDTPVKRYSSGMGVRLGFAVAAHLEPEILLVDEVLAVGDLEFQKKSLGKMDDVSKSGRTIIFVSHNMDAVMNLCPRTIWVHGGRVMEDGETHSVVKQYINMMHANIESVELEDRDDRLGDGKLRFTHIFLRDEADQPLNAAITGHEVKIVLKYTSPGTSDLKRVSVWFLVKDNYNNQILTLWSRLLNQDFDSLPPSGEIVCTIPRLMLMPRTYTLDIRATVDDVKADHLDNAVNIDVVSGDFYGTGQALSLISGAKFAVDHYWEHLAD